MRVTALYAIVLIIASSCANIVKPDKMVEFVENPENGLFAEKEMQGVQYRTHFRPVEYMASAEFLKKPEKTISEIINEVSGLQYFSFEISNKENKGDVLKKNVTSMDEYFQRIEYFSYMAQNDFTLVDGSDTLDCVLYHYERSYNLTPSHRLLLAFPAKKADDSGKQDKILSYNDQVFGSGRINLCITADNIQKIPKLIVQ